MDELSTERAGAGDWGSIADRTPPTSRARPVVPAVPEGRAGPGTWPEGSSLEPPATLWQRIEAQLRSEKIIR